MKETKCFALLGKECIALTVGKCYGRCAFYKTAAAVASGQAAAFERIKALPVEEQDQISANYYGGFYPWQWGKQ